jgi:UDP-N-acetylmuramoyl-tripeptide--D-alanyl-D-alanine ligase
MEDNNDFVASHDEVMYEGDVASGERFRVNHAGSSVPVVLYGALGRPRIYAALAGVAVAEALGIDTVSSSRGLATWVPPPGRMRLVSGIRHSTIIDDTYNSSPAAALAALDTLQSVVTSGRKIAILGDMLELGKYSTDAHKAVGERAAVCADMLITVGFRARTIAESALDAGMDAEQVRSYELGESARAGLELEREVRAGDVILVKGSQSMRMERTVEALLADSGKAGELLVRQEEEWKER